jgi:glycosyltransferase involved in cell wall biosynthesis
VAHALAPWSERYPDHRTVYRRVASAVLGRLLRRNVDGIAHHAGGHLVSASPCADFLVGRYGVARDAIGIVPQGVPEGFEIEPLPMTAERGVRMLHVAQYAFFKAPHIVAAVASAVLARQPEATFTWVCSRKHHAEVGSLFDRAIRERVSLLDWMPQDQLREVYDQHGLFLFPSFYEGFGKAFLEAMSRGLVVVASNTGGMRDLIDSGVNGFTVPVGDIEAMVSIIDRLLSDPGALRELGRRAAETAQRHTWSVFADRVGRFYARLLDARRGGLSR